jgi:hypothetical protein
MTWAAVVGRTDEIKQKPGGTLGKMLKKDAGWHRLTQRQAVARDCRTQKTAA